MRYTLGIGSYFGIPVKVHFTFPLILIAFGVEARLRGNWWDSIWAVLLVLAVFVCVVLHELGHSLQVRRYGIRVRDIVLLPIGGMARAESIPEKPWQEIVVAISGPLVNFSLAAFLLGIILLRGSPMDFENDFLTNLFSINVVLGTFNLIPAFPMDGGRILRGLLATRMSYLSATHHAKNVGQTIAIVFAIVGFMSSTFIMLPLIAVFIFFGAISEENMVKMKISLGGKTLKDFVRREIPVFFMEDPVESLTPYLENDGVTAFPVTDRVGILPAAIMREDAIDALGSCDREKPLLKYLKTNFPLLDGATPAIQAYHFLRSEKQRLAGVVEGGYYVGLVSFYDLSKGLL